MQSSKRPGLIEDANAMLLQARNAIVTEISKTCPTSSNEISRLVRQHIEIFGLQLSLENMATDQIAGVIDSWSKRGNKPCQ
ncbi:gamma-glutamyl phosphate reductase [Ochrobactrum anthropi]|nr:gamma-glutamyl phosphate reductase [Brucella anthropi]